VQALPFLKAPTAPTTRDVGTAESGILRFPVLGGLTVQESIVIDELLAQRPNAFVEAAKVATTISTAESITAVEAFTVIERAVGVQELEPEAQALRLKYADQINHVISIFSASNQHTTEAAVTALIRCRLDRPSWSVDDTRTLHRRLLKDIYDLYLDELDAENNPTSPVSEEELGKPQPASGRRPKRTGPKSPTSSSTTTPANTTEEAST
jgi:hypothetical protein